jgi:hypothetical protein
MEQQAIFFIIFIKGRVESSGGPNMRAHSSELGWNGSYAHGRESNIDGADGARLPVRNCPATFNHFVHNRDGATIHVEIMELAKIIAALSEEDIIW